jgi:hypothetical protein
MLHIYMCVCVCHETRQEGKAGQPSSLSHHLLLSFPLCALYYLRPTSPSFLFLSLSLLLIPKFYDIGIGGQRHRNFPRERQDGSKQDKEKTRKG